MKYKILLLPAVITAALNAPVMAHANESDQEATMNFMMKMIVDLGGHEAVSKNSGKTMRCSYGGSRKVSIVKRDATTTYMGDYKNCREKGSTRDGLYEIVIKDSEVISNTSKRSINGELFDGARQGDMEVLRKMIKAKADVNYTESIQKSEGGNLDEMTPLMMAVMSGNLDAVKLLVSNGAWVNYMNSMAVNALSIAANTGNTEIARYLLQQGAYFNNRNSEDVTPLMMAAMNGHIEIVRLLVSAKADLNLTHKEGDSALMFALAQRHTDIARLLIDSGADISLVNKFGVTALMIAVAEGNEEITRKLLDKKADTTVKTDTGKTALDVARARGLAGIVDLLEKAAIHSR